MDDGPHFTWRKFIDELVYNLAYKHDLHGFDYNANLWNSTLGYGIFFYSSYCLIMPHFLMPSFVAYTC